ncbi:unnamed protein product [Strongylus vulgaris]|uniref:Uncharacterized protein n=1 Tax=Strongylus vulgaris TaxID=40348 RepID=A0A3P7JIF5_STRVU|nr:unnamed protein product [Strongylus vulgaris]
MTRLIKSHVGSFFFSGFANFYSCLGSINIQNCLGLIGQVGNGRSPQDAYAYEGFLADWRFKCGAGFFVGNGRSPQDAYAYEGFLADWRFKCGAGFFAVYESPSFTSCTQSTYVNYNTDMGKIVVDYRMNITADPNNACK